MTKPPQPAADAQVASLYSTVIAVHAETIWRRDVPESRRDPAGVHIRHNAAKLLEQRRKEAAAELELRQRAAAAAKLVATATVTVDGATEKG